MMTGQYQHRPRLPYSPGMTYSGVAVYVTPLAAASGVSVGQRVAVGGIDAGPRSHGRYQSYGGCATYALCSYKSLRSFPSHWSFAEAASYTYGYDTATHCLVECGKVQKGESILIHGATGGVGLPAVQICLMLGLTVIATTRDEKKAELLKSMGVHHCIPLSTPHSSKHTTPTLKKFSADVKKLTKGKGVDIVYDGVGSDAITVESMHSLRFGGRLLIVGWAATPNVAGRGGGGVDHTKRSGTPNPNKIPTNLIMMKGLKIMGCPAMIASRFDPTLIPRRVKLVSGWIESGKLPPPVIANVFSLDDVQKALKSRVHSGSSFGSTVVEPSGRESEERKSKL